MVKSNQNMLAYPIHSQHMAGRLKYLLPDKLIGCKQTPPPPSVGCILGSCGSNQWHTRLLIMLIEVEIQS